MKIRVISRHNKHLSVTKLSSQDVSFQNSSLNAAAVNSYYANSYGMYLMHNSSRRTQTPDSDRIEVG